jgi:O-antigen/teichoic acid export membrane protein
MDRDKLYKNNTIKNMVYRFIVMGLSFYAVRLTLNYLGVEKYGIWVTILSVISWLSISDLGLGNGLRNKLSIALSQGNIESAREYIITTFYKLIKVSIIVLVITILLIEITSNIYNFDEELRLSLYIIAFGFSVNLVMGLSRYISFAQQSSALVGLTEVFTSFLSIIGILIISTSSEESMVLLSIIYILALFIANCILTLIVFKKSNIDVKMIKNLKQISFKEIGGLGIKFFIIQLCGIILFSTDNLIIANVINIESVTIYNILSKIFDAINSIFSVLLISVWSNITHAYSQNDIKWIKNTISKLKKYLIIMIIVVFWISIFFSDIVSLWLKQSLNFPTQLIIVFAVYTILAGWNGIYVNIINGIGNIDLQLYIALLSALINIPLSIFLAVNLDMGITGVKLATLICIGLTSIILPLQLKTIL